MGHPADHHYFRELDRRQASEEAHEAASAEIYKALLDAGHNYVDDERLVINLDADKLRSAYKLAKTDPVAAAAAFVDALEEGAGKAADEEVGDYVESCARARREDAAADRHEARRGG